LYVGFVGLFFNAMLARNFEQKLVDEYNLVLWWMLNTSLDAELTSSEPEMLSWHMLFSF
jgi:hypothetical protein